MCVKRRCGGGGLASEYRERHLQWVHPLGDWRFYYDYDYFVLGNHCSDLKIGRGETVLKTLCSECQVIEIISMQNRTGYIFKPVFKIISSVKMWGYIAVKKFKRPTLYLHFKFYFGKRNRFV